MIDTQIEKALQNQLTLERTNAAIYDALGAALDNVYWPGACAWMKHAANEEREHAEKVAGYLVDRQAQPVYNWIPQAVTPAGDDLVAYFEAALLREVATTAAILKLYRLAFEVDDFQTSTFLHWFVEEQTKSEREIVDILAMLRRLDANGRVVFDKSLS